LHVVVVVVLAVDKKSVELAHRENPNRCLLVFVVVFVHYNHSDFDCNAVVVDYNFAGNHGCCFDND